MSSTRQCPKCGATIPVGGLGGLCPRCVTRVSLRGPTPGSTTGPTPETSGEGLFEDYVLLEEIGRGGMGVVYRARQKSLNRLVALKVIASGQLASAEELRRFHTEANAAAALEHPHIVPIYEVGEFAQHAFFSMKLMTGGTLADLVHPARAANTLPGPRRAAAIVSQVARAVHHAHQRGILHRDLKPANILLDEAGNPFVSDFGLAKFLLPKPDSAQTLAGAPLGTPGFMAPEQAAERAGQITTAADVFSLGAMLYYLLAGRAPFEGETTLETLKHTVEEEPKRPSTFNGEIGSDLEIICLKCLEKEPSRRYASAAELADDLDRWQEGQPIRARAVPAWERGWLWARRRPAIAGLTLLAALLLLVGVAGIAWQGRAAARHADRAEKALRQATETLWQASYDRARALRGSGQMGQRVKALEAISTAAAIRPSPELRVEALAALALPDLEDTGRWLPLPADYFALHVTSSGNAYAYATREGLVRVHRFEDGSLMGEYPFGSPVHILWSSPDAGYFAMTDDNRLEVWNVGAKASLLQRTDVRRAAFHPHLPQVAVSERDGTVRIYSLSTAAELASLPVGQGATPVFSPDGEKLAVVKDRACEVWSISPPTRLGQCDLVANCFRHAWRPGSDHILLGCEDATLMAWDWQRRELALVGRHEREGVFVCAEPGGEWAATTSWDGILRLWSLAARRQVLEGRTVRPLGFDSTGQWLCVAGTRGVARWRFHWPEELRLLSGSFGPAKRLEMPIISPNSRWLAAMNLRAGFQVWDLATGQSQACQADAGLERVCWAGHDALLAASSQTGVTLWTNRGPADNWMLSPLVRLTDNQFTKARQARLTPNHDGLWLACEDRLELYDWPSGQHQQTLRGQPFFDRFDLSTDGRWIASGYWNSFDPFGSDLWVWSTQTGQRVRAISAGNCEACFSPDGRWLVIAEAAKYQQFALQGHPTNWVLAFTHRRENWSGGAGVAFSGDARWLVVAADKREFRLLESATGRELARFTPLTRSTTQYALSADHRWLVCSAEAGLHVWDLVKLRTRLRTWNLDWVD